MAFPFRVRKSAAIPERVLQELLALEGFTPFERQDETAGEVEQMLIGAPVSISSVAATDGGWDGGTIQ